ncbi:endocuticle structural glycoprotein SgAbd-1-like [Daphnia carinata]|uniref:endocuticle structural glycoprotein SgAbd-1-like n=1 Tax=Daphnia carinata TaxID=120202 RepID=UPI0028695E63|nr:endocuticle structural glycoprotein SgAbd-1-like [Daphnia carinata]XP_057377258.2 endocuticle structural glycoprotein SgAbd-1-like [Daphnia carinata]
MNRWFVLFAVCNAVSGIDARPQERYIMKPNRDIPHFVGGIPVPLVGQRPVMPMPSPMLLGLPVPLAGSVIPLALWPYFNQFNPFFISNGISKQRESTPVSISTSTSLDSENEMTTSIPMKSEESTAAPLTATQADLPSPVPMADSGKLADTVSQAVTQPSVSTPAYSTSPSSLAMSTIPVITIQRDGDYDFEYSVNNQESGDMKSHGEKRLNGVVTGYYSLVDADGMLRKVNYTADANGFRATVNRLPITSQ